MSNSPLVVYTKLSPNCNKPRNKKIDAIVVHHMAGNASVEVCGNIFANPSREASSNYGIGSDGRIAMYVEEANRSWCSSSGAIDHRAITIEVANDGGNPDWHVSDKAFESLVNLCADICKRNGIEKLVYTGDKSGNLHMHKWYAATGCPGPYLGSKFPELAEKVNAILGKKEEVKQEEPKKEEPKKEEPLAQYSDEELAVMVWRGDFGSGEERKKALGSRWGAVQALVDKGVGKNGKVEKKEEPAPAPAPVPEPEPEPVPEPEYKEYTIVDGDTLWDIGIKFDVDWKEIYELNKDIIGSNPDLIYTGTVIKIPNK